MGIYKGELGKRGYVLTLANATVVIVISGVLLIAFASARNLANNARVYEFQVEAQNHDREIATALRMELMSVVRANIETFYQPDGAFPAFNPSFYSPSNTGSMDHLGPQGMKVFTSTIGRRGAMGTGAYAANGSAPYSDQAIDFAAGQIFGDRLTISARSLVVHVEQGKEAFDSMLNRLAGAYREKYIFLHEFPANMLAAHGLGLVIDDDSVQGGAFAGNLVLDRDAVVGVAAIAIDSANVVEGAVVADAESADNFSGAAGSQLSQAFRQNSSQHNNVVPKLHINSRREDMSVHILADMTPDAEGIPQLYRLNSPGANTDWNTYINPANQCSLRIFGTQIDSDRISVMAFRVSLDTLANARNLGVPVFSRGITVGDPSVNGFAAKRVDGRMILSIDPAAAGFPGLGASQAIYVSVISQSGSHLPAQIGLELSMQDPTMGSIERFGMVSPNVVNVTSEVNTGGKPFALIAPEVRFGLRASAREVTLGGQRGTMTAQNPDSVRSLRGAHGELINANDPGRILKTEFTDIASSADLPPVVIRAWLVVSQEI